MADDVRALSIEVSTDLLAQKMELPPGCRIVEMHQVSAYVIVMTIEHPSFPKGITRANPAITSRSSLVWDWGVDGVDTMDGRR